MSDESIDMDYAKVVFKAESCRAKYSEYVKVIQLDDEVIPKPSENKRKMAIEKLKRKYQFQCLACKKILRGTLGSTWGIRTHLKVLLVMLQQTVIYKILLLFTVAWH